MAGSELVDIDITQYGMVDMEYQDAPENRDPQEKGLMGWLYRENLRVTI